MTSKGMNFLVIAVSIGCLVLPTRAEAMETFSDDFENRPIEQGSYDSNFSTPSPGGLSWETVSGAIGIEDA